jgi:SAM-dependent methyltransferase
MRKPVILGENALRKLLNEYEFKTVLDVGPGAGHHADIFRQCDKHVSVVEPLRPIPKAEHVFRGFFETVDLEPFRFDCIWACHVLEHSRNIGLFLDQAFHYLKDGGILAVTVPPLKPGIVGGHLTIWNPGLLLYNLVRAGFDCKDAAVNRYDYNISVIVKKRPIPREVLNDLMSMAGDLEKLAPYWPVKVYQEVNGDNMVANW